MPETLSVAEAGRRGGHARAAHMTSEQRRAEGRRLKRDRAVALLLDEWPELDPRQRERFRRLLQNPEEVEAL